MVEPKVSRIKKQFADFVSIDSVSFSEREMADVLKKYLQELGFEVSEDNAGSYYGSDTGNVYGFLKGDLPGEPLLFCSHMDTVTPGIGKKAVFHDDGTITSDGTTVLGADDAAGLIQILEGIRIVREAGLPHRDIEVLFPIGEELYDKGTDVFDFSKIRSKEAYVLDMSGEVGSAAIQAPTLISFEITVRGRASHAGFAPEAGINAIKAVSHAITKIKQGHLDEDTTLNIGTIMGGTATNIVSESCICTGEVRSFDHEKALKAVSDLEILFRDEIEKFGASMEMKQEINIVAYQTKETAPAVLHFKQAADKLGMAGDLVRTFGGSDNNNFARFGIEGIVLSCGMYHAHSVEEYTTVSDLFNGAKLVAQLIQLI